jgi:hypothetical protein
MNSLSQYDRSKRIGEVQPFAVTDSSMEALLQQAEAVAGAIRYYKMDGRPDGYFDRFLRDLVHIRKIGVNNFIPDGNLEPAQTLLFTFLKQLSETAEQFNLRWKEYADWYFHYLLGVKPFRAENHKVCLLFTTNTDEPVCMEKGLGFCLKGDTPDAPVYRLTEDTEIGNTSIEDIISIYFCKQKDMYPASELGFATSIQMKRLSGKSAGKGLLFGDGREDLKNAGGFGFILAAPSLLLREGKRTVSIAFEPENRDEIQEMMEGIVHILSQRDGKSPESIRYLALHDIFYLRFSISRGWKTVENYSVKLENGCVVLRFTLNEDFPETTPCSSDVHNFQSEFPALKVDLNLDAWLYPFSWFNKCLLKKIRIRTEVEGVSNLLVYNDLGKVDCSKLFQPFGNNTEKGTWMAVGSYEMAIKNTQSADLKIRWGQLPADASGFCGYYAGYGYNIDNTSFRVQSKYLSGYKWKAGKEYLLFGTLPDAPLCEETVLSGINTSKMPAVHLREEQYEYTINARAGFVALQLCSPGMGFGEKQYRSVFSDNILEKALHKKRKIPAPNPPFSPVIEKLTLNYTAEETVDLQEYTSTGQLEYYHSTPLSLHKIFPNRDKRFFKPVFEMGTHANLLILLKDLPLGGVLRLYVDFVPHKVEISAGQIPKLELYLGNGYTWEPMHGGFIVEDKTMNFLISGFIKINIPPDISSPLFDASGRIWLRIEVAKNMEVIPAIRKIYTHVAEVEFNPDAHEKGYHNRLLDNAEWSPEKAVNGLTGAFTVASYSGREKENREERLMRASEYASHRGRAVTARDYERIVLQAFPDIAKVKWLPSVNVKNDAKGVITLVVVPRRSKKNEEKYQTPLATSRQILNVEQYLSGLVSAYVTDVDVINPLYEEVIVRCSVIFKKTSLEALCHTRLTNLLDSLIAPWQKTCGQPAFDCPLDMADIRQELLKQEFVEEIKHFSMVVVSEKAEHLYSLYEYGKDADRILPSTPYSVFVPSKAHILASSDMESTFGIQEMTIGNSFIIS